MVYALVKLQQKKGKDKGVKWRVFSYRKKGI